jgi:alpha,alpha-trehalase
MSVHSGYRRRRAVARLIAALALGLLPAVMARPGAALEPVAPASPQRLFKDLFIAVQSAAIYPDGKTFADAVPGAAPDDILAQYHAARPHSPEQLRGFIEAHFSLPSQLGAAPSGAPDTPILSHIDALWEQLTRSTLSAPRYGSLLPLPLPYVVPGGRFREIYYWDSYFTMLGLEQSGRHDLVEDMVRDFAYLIDRYGHVPNGTRSYYLSRSQPPFFFEMVGLLSADDPDAAWAHYLPQLEREYAFWMTGAGQLRRGEARRRVVALPDGSILNRYWDDCDSPRDESYREDTELARATRRPARQLWRELRATAESGWDFSSRWLADVHSRATLQTTDIVPVDLNSLLFGLETAIASGCRRQGDERCAAQFTHRAAVRRAAIDRYLWDPAAGAYEDYQRQHHARIARISAATLYPLFVALASDAQAAAVANSAARRLLKPGGIVTTELDSGEQWDAPNGWAPLQWIAIAGLRRYGQAALAETVACRWMSRVNEVYRRSGKLVEKYDVINRAGGGGGGEYPLQDGFGWTNGVMRKLMVLYPADAALTDAADCPAAD